MKQTLNGVFKCNNPRGIKNITRYNLEFRCLHEHKVKQKMRQLSSESNSFEALTILYPTVNKQMASCLEQYTHYRRFFL